MRIRLVTLFLAYVMTSITFSLPADAAALNSTCSEKDWLKGTVKVFGKTKAQCVAGPDNYYWIALKNISPDARVAGPNENKRRSNQSSAKSQSNTSNAPKTTRVPNIMGFRTSIAESTLRSYGLRSSHVYRPQGGQAGANCAMTNSGVVTGMSIRPGTVVAVNTIITFATDC
jgi:beta-lactam-binding protein with PASTA domain